MKRCLLLFVTACVIAAMASPVATATTRLDRCSEAGVRTLVLDFVKAYNEGDTQELDALWAQQQNFSWYFVDDERETDARDRSSLPVYFSTRHALNDRMKLLRLSVRPGATSDDPYGFAFLLKRKTDDPRRGAAGRFHGKGSARTVTEIRSPVDPQRIVSCVLHLWAMDRDDE